MNRDKIRKFQIFSVIFTFVFGSLLHFTYSFSGNNHIVAVFSSINESVWEHLKLLYFPMLATTIFGYFYFGKLFPNFLCSKALGIVVAMAFTVVFFYTYTGVLGKDVPAVDISSFFVATLLGEFVAYALIVNRFKCNNLIAFIGLFWNFILFVGFCSHFMPKDWTHLMQLRLHPPPDRHWP